MCLAQLFWVGKDGKVEKLLIIGTQPLTYWGDIDEHGFQILHQLRSYCASAESILMDRQTFDLFGQFAVDGPHSKLEDLSFLKEEEGLLYKHLKTLDVKNRLEQEKIPQYHVEDFFIRNFHII